MKLLHNQRGSSHIVLILAIVVLVAVGFVGFRVMNQDDVSSKSDSGSNSASVPKDIDTEADVQKASKALDDTDIDSSVNPDQLDSDINATL